MPDEPNLFDLFRSQSDASGPAGVGRHPLDAQQIIRRARRRRLPRQIGIGALSTLAVATIGVAGFTGISGISGGSASTSSDSAVSDSASGMQPESATETFGSTGVKSLPDSTASTLGDSAPTAAQLNLCGAALADVEPNENGLELTANFADAPAGASTITGTVTLTNTGEERVTGYTAATPVITLSQNSVVLWHSNGPSIMSITEVDLAPGESLDYAASFTPSVCSADDELTGAFGTDLTSAPTGQYQIGAAIDLNSQESPELVTGPLSTITLY